MSVIADVTVPATEFPIGRTLGTGPGTEAALERVVGADGAVVSYFWVPDHCTANAGETFGTTPEVERVDVVDEVTDRGLLKVTCREDADGLLGVIAESNAVVLEGTGGTEEWTLRLRFDDGEELTTFHESCADRNVAVDLDRIHTPSFSGGLGLEFSLTGTQRETLIRAFEEGYFEVPRRTNLLDLARELDVSDTAVSQRIRRGLAALVAATLIDGDGEPPG